MGHGTLNPGAHHVGAVEGGKADCSRRSTLGKVTAHESSESSSHVEADV